MNVSFGLPIGCQNTYACQVTDWFKNEPFKKQIIHMGCKFAPSLVFWFTFRVVIKTSGRMSVPFQILEGHTWAQYFELFHCE